jgi:hypothetical protein
MYASKVFKRQACAHEKPLKNVCQLTQHHAKHVVIARMVVGSAKPGTLINFLPGDLAVGSFERAIKAFFTCGLP